MCVGSLKAEVDFPSSSANVTEQSLHVFIFFMCCLLGQLNPLLMAMEVTECSSLYSVKGLLIVHGEQCFGFGS